MANSPAETVAVSKPHHRIFAVPFIDEKEGETG
jgi:hypothetical protein